MEINWEAEARLILKAALKRKGVSYKQLAIKLTGMGIPDSASAIANRISRGTFSFAFFLQCMHAISTQRINVAPGQSDE